MKILKELGWSDRYARVQDLNKEDIKKLNKDKFHKTKNLKGNEILKADVYIVLKEDYDEYSQSFESLQSELNRVKKELIEKSESIQRLENKLSNIEEEHQKDIKKMDDEYSERVDKLNKVIHEKDLESERIKTKYEKEIGNLKEEYQKELNSLQIFDADYHMKISDHQEKIFAMEKEYNEAISGIKDMIARKTIILNDNINSLENSLQLIPYIKGEYKSSLESLKEDIKEYKSLMESEEEISSISPP